MIQRVLDEMERTGKPVPGTGPAATVKAKQRDPLMDIADVLGDAKRMTTQEVLQRLAERDEFYRAWTFADLTESLEPHGAPLQVRRTHVRLGRTGPRGHRQPARRHARKLIESQGAGRGTQGVLPNRLRGRLPGPDQQQHHFREPREAGRQAPDQGPKPRFRRPVAASLAAPPAPKGGLSHARTDHPAAVPRPGSAAG